MVPDGGVGLKPLRVAPRLAGLCLGLSALVGAGPVYAAAAAARDVGNPVVVELFTAQGCASCPQANRMLGDIAERKGVIALTFSVDYWDYLGWRDTFAMPEFTARQRAYLPRLKLKEVYTPETVVDGRREAPGVDEDKVDMLVEREAKTRAATPKITFTRKGRRVTVGNGPLPAGGVDVWLVRYDPMRRDVRVRSGENAGKTVTHINVVRELTRLGPWGGKTRSYDVPDASTPDLKAVVLVQGRNGGPILAAARE